MLAVREGRLAETPVEFAGGAACCVVMASAGYPLKYETGFPIRFPAQLDELHAEIYCAGVRAEDGVPVTAGGRVLGVTATAEDLPEAIRRAYAAVARTDFENAYYRHDIGKRALAAMEE